MKPEAEILAKKKKGLELAVSSDDTLSPDDEAHHACRAKHININLLRVAGTHLPGSGLWFTRIDYSQALVR